MLAYTSLLDSTTRWAARALLLALWGLAAYLWLALVCGPSVNPNNAPITAIATLVAVGVSVLFWPEAKWRF